MTLRAAIAGLLRADDLDSCIEHDESVLFFPTVAAFRPPAFDTDVAMMRPGLWEIPIHGWIYQPTELSFLRRAALRMVRRVAGLRFRGVDFSVPIFQQRMGAFLRDNERNNRVEIDLGGMRFHLKKSRPSGHFEGSLELPDSRVGALLVKERPDATGPAWLTFRAVMRSSDPRRFDGRVLFLKGPGVSVISDIDDTIKVTEVLDRRRMLRNTFLQDFAGVPGMAALYAKWANEGAAFHYVSASPWHLYPFLGEFFEAQGFPRGTFHLREFRLMPRDLRATLRPSRAVKLAHCRTLMHRFPERQFMLVGDSGEWDATIYAQLWQEFPTQVKRILIRKVREPGMDRVKQALSRVPGNVCQVFSEAAEIA